MRPAALAGRLEAAAAEFLAAAGGLGGTEPRMWIGSMGLAAPVLKGQVLLWGRRPWLAFRLPGLLKLP